MARRITQRVAASAAALIGLAAAGAAAPETVDLRTVPLSQPGTTLSKSCMGATGRDATLYEGLLLPMCRRLELTPEKNRADLDIAGAKCSVLFDHATGRFTFEAGEQKAVMEVLGPGLALKTVKTAAAPYTLAFPRSFCFMDKGVVFYTPACAQQGRLGDEVLALFDDNADGVYDTADALRVGPVGPTNLFVPIQGFVTTGRAIFQIERIGKDGASVSVNRYAGPTARMEARFAPSALLYQMGFESDQAKVSFTVASPTISDTAAAFTSMEVAVIPGRYRLVYGLVSSADGKVVALVLPRLAKAGGPLWTDVTADKPLVMPVGPATLDCQVGTDRVTMQGERRADFTRVSIPADSLVFRGALGEEYVPLEKPSTLSVEVHQLMAPATPPTSQPQSKLLYRLENLTKDSRGVFSFIAATAVGRAGLEPLRGRVRLRITVAVSGLAAAAERDLTL